MAEPQNYAELQACLLAWLDDSAANINPTEWTSPYDGLVRTREISKTSETLECADIGRRGRRRFDPAEPRIKSGGRRIVEEVRWDPHSIGRSERRLHCSRGMKPRGPGFFGDS